MFAYNDERTDTILAQVIQCATNNNITLYMYGIVAGDIYPTCALTISKVLMRKIVPGQKNSHVAILF